MGRTNYVNQLDRMSPATALNHANQIDQMNPASALNHTNQLDRMNPASALNHTDQINNKKPNNKNPNNNLAQEITINKINNMNCMSRLSDRELELKLKDLVTKERNLLHVILEHIKEVAARRLYLERAYSSLFEYLVKELGYSGSAAMRRIEAARLLKEVPAVAQKIQEGSLNLSQIGELSRAIKEKEKTSGEKISTLRKEHLVAAILGKSTQETQRELCSALDIQVKEQENQRVQKDDSVRLELTFSKEQYEKLSQCRDLLAHVLQQNQKDYSWASVMEALAEQYLNKKTGARSARCADTDTDGTTIYSLNENHNIPFDIVKVRGSSKTVVGMKITADAEVVTGQETITDTATGCGNSHCGDSQNRVECGCGSKGPHSRSKELRNRSQGPCTHVRKSLIPKIKVAVLNRDRCCQFVDPLTKKKCGTTFGLQIDHRTSRWAGGDHAEANLQALCQWHNSLKYKKESGIRFVSV